jgi:hypothetical protein
VLSRIITMPTRLYPLAAADPRNGTDDIVALLVALVTAVRLLDGFGYVVLAIHEHNESILDNNQHDAPGLVAVYWLANSTWTVRDC